MLMSKLNSLSLITVLALLSIVSVACASDHPALTTQTVSDAVYLQEVGRQVASSIPLTSIAVFKDQVFAGSSQGLLLLADDRLVPVGEVAEPIQRLVTTDDSLWAITSHGLYRYQATWTKISDDQFTVTQDPEARARAVDTFRSLCWLETMTPMPRFIARSVWAKGEIDHQADYGLGGEAAEWHDTSDGIFEWKGDTSSD